MNTNNGEQLWGMAEDEQKQFPRLGNPDLSSAELVDKLDTKTVTPPT